MAHLQAARVALVPMLMEGSLGCNIQSFITNWENVGERGILQTTLDAYGLLVS